MKSKSLKSILPLWGHLNIKNKILFAITTFSSIFAAFLETQVLITFIPLITKLTSNSNKTDPDLSIKYNIIFKELYSSNTPTEKVLLVFSFLVIF